VTATVSGSGRLLLAALALLLTPAVCPAQEPKPGKIVRIGRLSPLSATADAYHLEVFRKGLRDLGWIEGTGFVIESRFADGQSARLPELATDLVRQRVDLILTGSNPGGLAAKKATASIPIVLVTTGDPVRGGIVASLARPGGNITGVTALGQTLYAKRLDLHDPPPVRDEERVRLCTASASRWTQAASCSTAPASPACTGKPRSTRIAS
jgi:putative ABC transport system substrate-binding protein